MRYRLIKIISFLSLITLPVYSNTLDNKEIIDLSYEFSNETIYWPTSKSFKSETVFEGMTNSGYYYSTKNFYAAEHGGTHIDAPIHFSENKNTVDKIPLKQLVSDAIVVDVSSKVENNNDYQININDFEYWEKEYGKIPENSIVFLRTGKGKYWPDRLRYLGTTETGPSAVSKLHFPGLHPNAAKWLVINRKINAIGLDTPSIDYGQSKKFESHQILFKQNIPAFENVANLHKLPIKGSFVIALPMKIKNGSGSPVRIIAFIPKENNK